MVDNGRVYPVDKFIPTLNSGGRFALRLNNDVNARDMKNLLGNEVKGDLDCLGSRHSDKSCPEKPEQRAYRSSSIVHRIMKRQTLSKSVAHFFISHCLDKT
jgi:hypothetical protein